MFVSTKKKIAHTEELVEELKDELSLDHESIDESHVTTG